MFPEVAPTELIVVGIVALLVVGPKDLPVLLRKLGQWVSKIRGLAAEFKSSFSEMARQSELDDLRKEVEALRGIRYDNLGGAELKSNFDEIKASIRDVPTPGLHDWEVGSLYSDGDPSTPVPATDATAEPAPAAKSKRAAKPKPKAKAEAAPKAKSAKTTAAKASKADEEAPKAAAKPRSGPQSKAARKPASKGKSA